MKDTRPKVFIGTLFAGENELDQCIASVESQTYPAIAHEVIRNLPNKQAHETLYSRFMELSGEYAYFIKLDADMVLRDSGVVGAMVALFETSPGLDHAIFTVHDWYSQSDIMGLHMFSPRARWKHSPDPIFVDHNPHVPGDKFTITQAPAPVALHNPNPSLEYAYKFGIHRALKVVQRDRFRKRVGAAEEQFELLATVWSLLVQQPDPRRAAVIQGAEDVFGGKMTVLEDKSQCSGFDIETLGAERLSHFIRTHRKHWTGIGLHLRRLRYFGWIKYGAFLPYQKLKRLFSRQP